MISTALKRAALEDFWEDCQSQNAGDLRLTLRQAERSARENISQGAIAATSGFGQSSSLFGFGPGQITPTETVEMCRQLIDRFDKARDFLAWCSKYGLDSFTVARDGPPSSLTAVASPVLVDTSGRWADAIERHSTSTVPIAAADVIGQPVGTADANDAAIYIWMMLQLVPITSFMADFTSLRVSPGAIPSPI